MNFSQKNSCNDHQNFNFFNMSSNTCLLILNKTKYVEFKQTKTRKYIRKQNGTRPVHKKHVKKTILTS